ncbi:unnamed protein product [Ceratitis capitata]|uniref:(Mediterranean fruit fly) hypothetical protein n=1 Tax=Ceratitis capitata TaxID=7213 RepID=A0A811UN68_CERCA|nr:unnamed protein product [Ceratitis capitata]
MLLEPTTSTLWHGTMPSDVSDDGLNMLQLKPQTAVKLRKSTFVRPADARNGEYFSGLTSLVNSYCSILSGESRLCFGATEDLQHFLPHLLTTALP